MAQKIYNSYSTNYKLAVIYNKKIECNYNNKYYWSNKGKTKILQAIRNENQTNLNNIDFDLNSEIKKLMDDVFSFVHSLIDQSKKIIKLFKKSKEKIISLCESLKPFAETNDLCKWFKISESTLFSWKNRVSCKTSYIKECPNSYPNQLRDWERRTLEDEYFFNNKYDHYSISDLLGQVMADKKVIVSESLFYQYAALIGETTKRKIPRKKKKYIGLRAEKPKAIIHMDKSKFKIKNTNGAWLNLICDNKSRAILSFTVCIGSHSRYTLYNLKSAIKNHSLLDKSFWLVTDDGSENKGEVKLFVKSNPNIKHKIAQKNIPYSNSMVEAVFKQLKYYYLPKKEFDSLKELTELLTIAIKSYNNRPRKIHLGKTPLQVLNGDEVDLADYTELKKQVLKERIEENRNFSCLKHLYVLHDFKK